MRTKSLTALAASIGVILATGSTQVMAQGFGLYNSDVATMGSAYAGSASNSENATVVQTNPAAISRLEGIQASTNATLILANSDIKNPVGSAPGTNKGDMVPQIIVGSTFVTVPHVGLENLSLGFGVYAPFGLKTNYEDTFQGRSFGDKSVVTVATFQPTVAYAFAPNLSVGAGLTINHINGLLSSGVSPAVPNASTELAGSDNALGYNVGVMFSPIKDFDLGLTYHSKVDYKLTGSSEALNLPITNTPYTFMARGDGSLKLTTPDSLEFGASFKLIPTLDVKFGYTRTWWSTIKTLTPSSHFTSAGITPSVPLPAVYSAQIAATLNGSNASAEELNFKDTNMYSLGAAWQVHPKVTLRAGVAFDETPIQDKYRNVRLPLGDRTIFAVGANYKITDKTNVDFGYNYLMEQDAKINRADATKGIYQATFQNSGNLVALQLNHQF
ncbi:OmpP1/FadL family transporter [Aquirhabdus parva]|uniref:Transporter n=1 Tax=Aquirhabdus parva TaxID=2283318 RepID=A0A345P5R1_9GAMM|nr:outer membrane protein transport protein [Aquirhabdus parva]AXI02620.1 transporter [Aquirhabdus parva]